LPFLSDLISWKARARDGAPQADGTMTVQAWERWVATALYWLGVVLVLVGWGWGLRAGRSGPAVHLAEAGLAMVIVGRVVSTVRRRQRRS
ncbi:MAG: hypothetical protein ACYC6M_06110, partial [Terriglobales bacterium]